MKSASSLDMFLKQIKASNYYCQTINSNLKYQKLQQISIKLPQNRQHEFVSKCPQIKFSLSEQIILKLAQDIGKSRRTKNGLISAYLNTRFKHKMQKIHYFSQNDEQDIGVCQQAEDAFCVGFIVQKQGNYEQFNKRLSVQLKKCLQKRFQEIIYAKNTKSHQSLSQLNHIDKVLYKHFRFFLVFQQTNSSLLVNRIMYYPDAKFLIKPIKLVPSKFTANKVYEQVLTFKQKFDYGYLSLSNNSRTKQIRFLLIDKFDPQLNQNPPPMIGIWVSAEKFQSKQEQKNYFWAVIMEYLRNPSLKIKLSLNYQNTGILFTIQKPHKIIAYIFEIIEQPKWNFKYQPSSTFKIPEQYIFTDQEVIVEEDRQESDIQSIQNKQTMNNNSSNQFFNSNSNQCYNNHLPENNYQNQSNTIAGSGISQSCDLSKSSVQNKSSKSNEQKQLEIKFLKRQLQFYKNRCQALQKMMNNPAMMQLQAMQMLNPLTNAHLAFNSMMYQSLQNNNLPNQQINYTQTMMNPGINMMMNNQQLMQNQMNNHVFQNQMQSQVFQNQMQSQVFQNQTLPSSTLSKNDKKILNQSQLYQQQLQTVPQPVPINKQLAFSKKKTFQQQKYNKVQQTQKTNLKKKQSCPLTFQDQQSQHNKKDNVLFGQFSYQQDMQISPNANKHFFQYDYKNISFAQDNQFDNQLNSTQKFASFQIDQSQIFGKSPDTKKSFNLNNYEKSSDVKNQDSLKQKDTRKRQISTFHQFSFDRKDNDFISGRNSKRTLLNNQTKLSTEYQGNKSVQDPQTIRKSLISKLQTKYSRDEYVTDRSEYNLGGLGQRQKSKIKERASLQNQRLMEKQQLSQEKGSSKKINTSNQNQRQILKRKQQVERGENVKKVPLKGDQQEGRQHQYSLDIIKTLRQDGQDTTDGRKQSNFRKPQQKQQNGKSPPLSRIRQPIQNSDSDSDQQLKTIAMKYRK